MKIRSKTNKKLKLFGEVIQPGSVWDIDDFRASLYLNFEKSGYESYEQFFREVHFEPRRVFFEEVEVVEKMAKTSGKYVSSPSKVHTGKTAKEAVDDLKSELKDKAQVSASSDKTEDIDSVDIKVAERNDGSIPTASAGEPASSGVFVIDTKESKIQAKQAKTTEETVENSKEYHTFVPKPADMTKKAQKEQASPMTVVNNKYQPSQKYLLEQIEQANELTMNSVKEMILEFKNKTELVEIKRRLQTQGNHKFTDVLEKQIRRL